MSTDGPLDIFLVTSPGFERVLFQEARAKGFASARYEPGGVTLKGTWQDVWRANFHNWKRLRAAFRGLTPSKPTYRYALKRRAKVRVSIIRVPRPSALRAPFIAKPVHLYRQKRPS